MKQDKKNIVFCLAAVLITILVLYLVYGTIDKKTDVGMSRSKLEQLGEIETPGKKWLNGYWGIFFRFKALGNINWLIFPLLIWFLVTAKKRERWQMALLFVWLVTVVFISLKGYSNPRYQLTLFPITSAMVLLLLWQFLENRKTYTRIFCFSLLAAISLFNIFNYFDRYDRHWELRVSCRDSYFPSQLVDYLNTAEGINDRWKVFVINQPLFYYYTDKKGVDYMSPHAMAIWNELKVPRGHLGKAHRLLRKTHRARYILLKSIRERYSRRTTLNELLNCDCRLVLEDKGRRLYRVRDKTLFRELKLPHYKKLPVWKKKGTTAAKISPPLIRVSRRGIFKLDIAPSKKGKQIVVRNRRAKKGERRINLGYEFKRRSIDMKIPEGKYIHFVVKAGISKRLVGNKNYIMIADYNGADKTWEQEKTYFRTPHTRTYLVSKKIRPGSTRTIMVFRFEPVSRKDRLRIENVEIVVSDEPL